MLSIDEAQVLLQEVADELPDAFWNELNGGVSLLPDIVPASYAATNDLYTLGEYRVEPLLGRYINIYYGSLQATFGNLSAAALKRELRRVLFHEFTHHVESLAGEHGLEIKDALQMQQYLNEQAGIDLDSAAQALDDYEIRPATEKDLPAIRLLYETLFSELAALSPDLYRPARQSEAFLRDALEAADEIILVAADAQTVLGLALIQIQVTPDYTCLRPHRYGVLIDLIVTPHEREQGIGSELLSAAKDWAREQSLDYLEVNVLSNNIKARAAYKNAGFAEKELTLQVKLSDD